MATKISRKGALEATRDGGKAFRDGKKITDCPYPSTGDVGDEFMAHYWRKGFLIAESAA